MDATNYGKEFYERAKSAEGVDYVFYGDWQLNYAKMIVDITDILKPATDERESLLLDIGCAAGVTMRGFKETGVFGQVKGIDISPYLIDMGMKAHDFDESDMQVVNIATEPLPFDDDSVTLLHCSHVLEHIEEEHLEFILSEFHRVLKPEVGIAFLVIPSIKPGNPKEAMSREETHVTIKTIQWWNKQFRKLFRLDSANIRKKFKDSLFSPDNSDNNFHHYYNIGWTIYGLRKES